MSSIELERNMLSKQRQQSCLQKSAKWLSSSLSSNMGIGKARRERTIGRQFSLKITSKAAFVGPL